MSLSDDEVKARLAAASDIASVDGAIIKMIDEGGIPSYIAVDSWKVVDVPPSGGHTLQILVAPDYGALGHYRLARESPYGAQYYADKLNAILPSRKLMRDIQNASNPKIPFIDVKGPPWHVPIADIETQAAANDANDGANSAFAARGIHPGERLTIGYKKAVITGPNLDGSKVAIFGGIPPSGKSTEDPPYYGVVQGYSTVHGAYTWSDYSHGIVLVSRKAWLDGKLVDLRMDVFGSTDPKIYGLVSDQGRFDPIYPNYGTKSRAKFGASGGGTPPPPPKPSTPSSPKPTSPTPPPTPTTPPTEPSTVSSVIKGILRVGLAVGAAATAWYFLR